MRRRHINKTSHYKKRKVEQGPVINNRYKILIGIIVIIMFILLGNLYYVQVVRYEYYQEVLAKLTQNIIEGETAPRGRIYDRNGKLLVDNIPVKTITYKRALGTNVSEELDMSYEVADLLEVDFSRLRERELRKFWVRMNPAEANVKITSEERTLLKERKITSNDIEEYKLARITAEELGEYDDRDKEAAYIYFLMSNGYSFAEKRIKASDVTDEEYAIIAENGESLKGFKTRLDWERHYPYGNTFKTILGSVSSTSSGIPAELKDQYLAVGYQLNDRVGISYLEYQYESILRGTKNKYMVTPTGEHKLIEEGRRGNDIVLTIDIELQKAVEKIIEDEIRTAQNDAFAKYFDTAFVVIQDPNTGEILAMAGRESKNGKIHDYTTGVINASVTAGSSIKAASQMVGYITGNLNIGEIRNDACIKIAATPLKCSYTRRGNINDITALQISSNTYQFQTAIKVGKGTYRYNQALPLDPNAFNTYRSIFADFGLGVKTGIDLPNEDIGYRGTSTLPGLLLDFSIGQYDNYTPIQLSQYISTVAVDGKRVQPRLLKAVYEPTNDKLTNLVYQTTPVVLNTLDANPKYLARVKEGLNRVLVPGGTGVGFIRSDYRAAGKTGTSESFLDVDGDGKIDIETISAVFVAYAPLDKPTVSFTVVTPDIGYGNQTYGQLSRVNQRITDKVSRKYFEMYK